LAITPKQLYAGTPATTGTDYYTVPANTTTVIKNIVLVNTTGSSATITLQVAYKDVISAYTVNAKDTVVIDLSLVMTAGQKITISQGTANAINVFISGVEVA
jgi:hypothetical protein